MPHIARSKSQALFETRDLLRIPTIFNQPQAAQAPAVRWSSYEITFMARVCMGIFTTALRNKKISQILTKNTSPYFHSALLVIWPLTTLKGTHLSELSILRFSTSIRKALFLWGTTSKAHSERLQAAWSWGKEHKRIRSLERSTVWRTSLGLTSFRRSDVCYLRCQSGRFRGNSTARQRNWWAHTDCVHQSITHIDGKEINVNTAD